MAVHNAYVLFKEQNDRAMPSLKFRLELIDMLLHAAGPDPLCCGRTGRPRSVGTDLLRLNTQNHYPSHNETSEQTGRI